MIKFNFLIIVLCIFCLASCDNNKVAFQRFDTIISDSFYVEYNSQNGANFVIFLDSITCLYFDRFTNEFTLYKDSAKHFKNTKSYNIPQDIKMWYTNFPYYNMDTLKFVDKESTLYTCLLSDSIKILNKQPLDPTKNASIVHGYYPSSLGFNYHQSLIYNIIPVNYTNSPGDLKSYVAHDIFAAYNFDNNSFDTLVSSYTFGKKPSNLLALAEPFSRFTFNSLEGKVAIIYEGFNTIDVFDLNTQNQTKIKIDNPYFTAPPSRKPSEFFERINMEEYHTFLSSNFRYTGIRYNKNTNHYLLTFTTPQPTVKDWLNTPMKGIVLDGNFKTLYYIEFESDNGPLKQGDFVLHGDKVAIRTNNIESNKTNYEKYYILNP